MSRLLIFIIMGIGSLFVAYGVAYWIVIPRFAEDQLRWKQPTVPQEFMGELTIYWDKGMENPEVVDGSDLFVEHHRHGWEACRRRFCFGMNDWRYEDDPGQWSVGAPGYVNMARQQGWKRCSDQLEALLRNQSEEALRHEIFIWRRTESIVAGVFVLAIGIALSVIVARAVGARSLSHETPTG